MTVRGDVSPKKRKCQDCVDVDSVPSFPLKCGAKKLWDCPKEESSGSFQQKIELNKVKAKEIPEMIKKLNEIRGEPVFDDMEFVPKKFVLAVFAEAEQQHNKKLKELCDWLVLTEHHPRKKIVIRLKFQELLPK